MDSNQGKHNYTLKGFTQTSIMTVLAFLVAFLFLHYTGFFDSVRTEKENIVLLESSCNLWCNQTYSSFKQANLLWEEDSINDFMFDCKWHLSMNSCYYFLYECKPYNNVSKCSLIDAKDTEFRVRGETVMMRNPDSVFEGVFEGVAEE